MPHGHRFKSWERLIEDYRAKRIKVGQVLEAFDADPTLRAVYFETRNMGFIVLREPDEDGRKLYSY